MRPIVLFIAAVIPAIAAPPPAAALMKRYAAFTDGEIDALRRGERVIHAISTDRQEEVAFAGATRLPITVTTYLGRLRAGTLYRPGENVLGIGRFGEPPRMEDLRSLRFESYDLESGVERNQRALLSWIQEYERTGTIGKGPLGATPARLDPATCFEPMVREAGYLRERLPAAYDYLLRYPNAPERGRDDFYLWTQLTFGFRPLTRIAQVSIWEEGSEAMVVTKQIYANRYFDASFQVDHLVAEPSGLLLITLNYGRSELLEGIAGKLIRPVVVSRTLAMAAKTLDQARKDLRGHE
jgi:hypothetical protein